MYELMKGIILQYRCNRLIYWTFIVNFINSLLQNIKFENKRIEFKFQIEICYTIWYSLLGRPLFQTKSLLCVLKLCGLVFQQNTLTYILGTYKNVPSVNICLVWELSVIKQLMLNLKYKELYDKAPFLISEKRF